MDSLKRTDLIQEIGEYIDLNHLLEHKAKCLVALSGGADSVMLLLALSELGYAVEAVHCNFHLRGAESDRDEQFCRDMCDKMHINLHLVHFDTVEYSQLHHVSIEMAARELRYKYFERLRIDIGAEAICVGHHKDDNVETILMNIVRGTGLNGLIGIKPRQNKIVRPLLNVSRKDIECFLEHRNIGYVTDSTNYVDDVVRNKLRLNIIPMLQEINPSVKNSILRLSKYVAGAKAMIDSQYKTLIDACLESKQITFSQLDEVENIEYFLYMLLYPLGFNHYQIERLSDIATSKQGRSGEFVGRVFLSTTHKLLVDRKCMIMEPIDKKEEKSITMPETGIYRYDDNSKIKLSLIGVNENFEITRDKNVIFLDYNKLSFPLKLNHYVSGDRFVPFGMKGSKLVSDFLTDQKKSRFDKERQLVLRNGNGDILWVVGNRPDNRYRILNSTTEVLKVSWIQDF